MSLARASSAAARSVKESARVFILVFVVYPGFPHRGQGSRNTLVDGSLLYTAVSGGMLDTGHGVIQLLSVSLADEPRGAECTGA